MARNVEKTLAVVVALSLLLALSGCTQDCGSLLGVQRMEDGSTVVGLACTTPFQAGVVRVDRYGNEIWSYRYPEAYLDFPHSAFWNPDGTMIIADTHQGRIILIDTETKQIVWNSSEVPLSDPSIKMAYTNFAILLPNGNILTSLRDAHIVLEFELDGTIVWSFGEYGVTARDDHHLNGPHWPQRLANGNTLIPDSWNNRVIEVTPQGEVVWRYEPAELPYFLQWPRCAQEMKNGHILITDPHDIWEVTRQGEVVKHIVRPWDTTDWGYAAIELENGNYLLNGFHRIDEMTREGQIVWTYCSPYGCPPPPIMVQ